VSAALSIRGLVVAPAGTPVLRGVDLEIAAGSRAVLVGPSGAGKTTLLRAIAGLEALRDGVVELGGRRLDRAVPAHRRRVSVVFQEPRLLPHARVDDNVALPLRAGRAPRGERRRLAAARLEEVGLAGMGTRAVRGLSGGEQQRVALARALCAEPDLLLLDEPLGAVDPNRREALRRLIVGVQRERSLTTLIITHDRAEAAELAETLALMLEGRIIQQHEPRELFERPRSAAVARFFGAVNILRGTVRDGVIHVGRGGTLPVTGPDGPAACVIRPEAVRLADTDAALHATVVEAVYAGTFTRVRLELAGQRLEAHVPPATRLMAGEEVGVHVPPEQIWRLPGDGARQLSAGA
jgi:putative spermidine/putrescine transport system ATP-binding protein